jgi:hypothetical protein
MVDRKIIRQLPKKPHKFIKAVLTPSLTGRTNLFSYNLTFINTLQCWEISLANSQINTRLELAFMVLEFPKGGAEKGLETKGLICSSKNIASLKCSHKSQEYFFFLNDLLHAMF